MITNDASLLDLKHKILEEVARLAWKDELNEEGKQKLVYELIPGPLAKYRCCVYKDRPVHTCRTHGIWWDRYGICGYQWKWRRTYRHFYRPDPYISGSCRLQNTKKSDTPHRPG